MNAQGAHRKLDYRILILLWIISLMIYAPSLQRWSLTGDEFYTFEDSTFSISKMLSFNSRPLYFIVCHYLLKWFPNWPVEFTIRLPSMLAVSLVAPALYGMLRTSRYSAGIGILAAAVAVFNPWLFQMSQFGRYYGFVIFFSTIATIAALRFLDERKPFWPVVLLVSGGLSAASHPPSILVVPAGILGWIAVAFVENREQAILQLKKYGVLLVFGFVVAVALGGYLLRDVLVQWATAQKSDFGGGYDLKSIVMSLGIVGGLATWCLALLPLLRDPKSWTPRDIFLGVFFAVCTIPLMMLVPFGGGVSSRYLLFCLPCVFVLAGQHWHAINSRLPTLGYKFVIGCAVLACNVPLLMSAAADGDAYDYRQMAKTIEALEFENPIIYSSNHRLMDYYLSDSYQIMSEDEDELGELAGGIRKKVIERGIQQSKQLGRPLLLVSRQDRALFSPSDQAWLYERFAVLRTIEKARYDHRRHRLILYHYRPVLDRCQ